MELRPFFFKTLIVAAVIITFYALYQVRSLLFLFFGAILFASTIRPIVQKLAERGVLPWVSILVSYVVLLGVIAGIAIILVPTLFSSTKNLLDSQTVILMNVENTVVQIQSLLLNGVTQAPLVRAAELQRQLTEFQTGFQARVEEILLNSVIVASEALILFVMAFYWLTERDHLEELILKMLRLKDRERFISLFGEIENTLGAFVRGQLILAVTLGVLAFVSLSLLGVRSALPLAMFAAVAELIPMIGPFLGAAPAILIALLDSPQKALFVTLAFVIIQQIEAQILVPKVMERQVNMSPLLVLLAITAGYILGGIGGALVAIPLAAALKIIVHEFLIAPTVEARKFPVTPEGAVLLDDVEASPPATVTLEPTEPTPTVLTAK